MFHKCTQHSVILLCRHILSIDYRSNTASLGLAAKPLLSCLNVSGVTEWNVWKWLFLQPSCVKSNSSWK